MRYGFFHRLPVFLALVAGVQVASAQSTLSVLRTNNEVVFFWPPSNGGTNGVLQSTTNLISPNWIPATDAIPFSYGAQTAVILSNSPPARFFRLSLVPPTIDGMALVSAGPFTMGDTLDGDTNAIPTNVYVSACYMDTNLVSYGQWQAVYNWATNAGYGFDNAGSGVAANHPVQTVDWYDAVKWCNARSQQSGLTPVYYTDPELTRIYTTGQVTNPNVNWSATGYRLPTEAEWEKAARGGLSGQRFPWGDTISESQANYLSTEGPPYDLGPKGYNANFDTGAQPYTSPVGYFAANGYGLHDMAGNVLEWCWDWYAPTLAGGSDPRGPATGIDRLFRGGQWGGIPAAERCAHRVSQKPFNSFNDVGFRCVREF